MADSRAYRHWGFASFREYTAALAALPTILGKRAFQPLMPADALKESGVEMKRVLGPVELILMGIGMMLGAGVYVTTGYVAAHIAGPGVVISYILAGFSALLSSFCYAEFAVDIPAAGGAYTYIAAALGEFIAWLAVSNLIFEYVLSNAAAVRGFSSYFAALTNKPETFYIHNWVSKTGTRLELDFWGLGWCILLSGLLVFGTKESSLFNSIVTGLNVTLVSFIIVAGLVKARAVNARPFLPFGIRGAFEGASRVFFSYIGFDAVATAAEETRNPRRDLPIGILGSVMTVTVIYTMMGAALMLMVPREALLGMANAGFATAFRHVGWNWAVYVVAIGALMGILTSTLVGMYGASRIITGVARDHLIPPGLARVGRFQTPWIAIIIQGAATGLLALLSPFSELADMVSISTLFAFWVVALGLVWRRSCTDGAGHGAAAAPGGGGGSVLRRRLLVGGLLAGINGGAIIFTVGWKVAAPGSAACIVTLSLGGGALLLSTAALHAFARPTYTPPRYSAPAYPWLPSLSMAVNVFLLGQLGEFAYIRFAYWTAACVGTYLLYSGAASWNKARRSGLPVKAAELIDTGPPGETQTGSGSGSGSTAAKGAANGTTANGVAAAAPAAQPKA